jgi:hypothetical protein
VKGKKMEVVIFCACWAVCGVVTFIVTHIFFPVTENEKSIEIDVGLLGGLVIAWPIFLFIGLCKLMVWLVKIVLGFVTGKKIVIKVDLLSGPEIGYWDFM